MYTLLCQVKIVLCLLHMTLSLLNLLSKMRVILLVYHVDMSNYRGVVEKRRENPRALANATEKAGLDAVLQTTLKHTAKHMEDLLKSMKQKR